MDDVLYYILIKQCPDVLREFKHICQAQAFPHECSSHSAGPGDICSRLGGHQFCCRLQVFLVSVMYHCMGFHFSNSEKTISETYSEGQHSLKKQQGQAPMCQMQFFLILGRDKLPFPLPKWSFSPGRIVCERFTGTKDCVFPRKHATPAASRHQQLSVRRHIFGWMKQYSGLGHSPWGGPDAEVLHERSAGKGLRGTALIWQTVWIESLKGPVTWAGICPLLM